jgi:hypothetical protein
MRAARFVPLLGVLVGACGLGHSDVAAILSDGSTGGGDASPAIGCPLTVPAATACPESFTGECEYGSDPNYRCNQILACTRGTWTPVAFSYPSDGAPTCPTPRDSQCPATEADVSNGGSCTTPMTCGYATGVCDCAEPELPTTGTGVTWACDDADVTCPQVRPSLGETCATGGQTCNYGACTIPEGVALECMGGTWQVTNVACPL